MNPLYIKHLFLFASIILLWTSLVAQTLKNLPAIQETQIRSLGEEDPLEKEIATDYSILAWRIQWTEDPGGLQSMGSQRVIHNLVTKQQQQKKLFPSVTMFVLYHFFFGI